LGFFNQELKKGTYTEDRKTTLKKIKSLYKVIRDERKKEIVKTIYQNEKN
jgi:hypothetical protein